MNLFFKLRCGRVVCARFDSRLLFVHNLSAFLSRYGLTEEELEKSPLCAKVERVIALKMSDTDDVVVRMPVVRSTLRVLVWRVFSPTSASRACVVTLLFWCIDVMPCALVMNEMQSLLTAVLFILVLDQLMLQTGRLSLDAG